MSCFVSCSGVGYFLFKVCSGDFFHTKRVNVYFLELIMMKEGNEWSVGKKFVQFFRFIKADIICVSEYLSDPPRSSLLRKCQPSDRLLLRVKCNKMLEWSATKRFPQNFHLTFQNKILWETKKLHITFTTSIINIDSASFCNYQLIKTVDWLMAPSCFCGHLTFVGVQW